MKVYTLLQTDTDTVLSQVTVYTSYEEAVEVAKGDIERNKTKIEDIEEKGRDWTCVHTDGHETFWSVVKEHEV